jgi:hypothetical protein
MFRVLTLAWATAPVDLSGARDIRVRVTNSPILLPVPSIGELAGFRLLRPLGLPGSFGTVFEAERDGARFALKLFHSPLITDEEEERFRREVEVLSSGVSPEPRSLCRLGYRILR